MQPKPSSRNSIMDQVERRRSGRIYLKLPVIVRWLGADGETVREPAFTEEISSGGGLLHIKRPPPESAEIEVTHSAVEEPVGARIVRFEEPQGDGLARIAIAYARQFETLWGVTFPAAKAAAV